MITGVRGNCEQQTYVNHEHDGIYYEKFGLNDAYRPVNMIYKPNKPKRRTPVRIYSSLGEVINLYFILRVP